MPTEDVDRVPVVSESVAEPLVDVAGEGTVLVEVGAGESPTVAEVASLPPWHHDDLEHAFGTLWSPNTRDYTSTQWELGFSALRWAQTAFDAEWMSFVTRCPQNKIRTIAEGHLDRIAAELGDEAVGRIVRGVDEAGRRRVGGLAWSYFLKRDTDGYERVVLKYGQPTPSASAAMVAEIRRWVGNRFPELPSDQLSVLLFRAADKVALESLPLPNCEHTWQRTSLPVPGKRHGEAFEECSKCSALRPVLWTEEDEQQQEPQVQDAAGQNHAAK